jgi:hypothetical protein
VPLHALPVDVGAVAAAAILQPVFAALGYNPGVRAGNPAVPNDEVILRLPSYLKRQRIERRTGTMSVRIDHH